jgi:elongation factor Tu
MVPKNRGLRQKHPRIEHTTVGTIGHVGHGKTTVTSAITMILSEQGKAEFVSCEKIAFPYPPGTRVCGGSYEPNILYQTDARYYSHVRPGDDIKKMITGQAQMDGAILVISAKDGPISHAKEHIRVARQIGIRHIVVWINKCDLVDDPELLDRVEMEVRELLCSHEFKGDETPVIRGSANNALLGDAAQKENIIKLIKAMDEYIPTPKREVDKPFLHIVEDVFSITGRGTVASGYVLRGEIKVGEKVDIVGWQAPRTATVTGIEMYQKKIERAIANDNVGIFLDIESSQIQRGQVIAQPASIKAHTRFKAEVYVLNKEEAGRDVLFSNGYRPHFCIHTANHPGSIKLHGGMETITPGTNAALEVELIQPVALEEGLRFAIREEASVIGAGVVTGIIE